MSKVQQMMEDKSELALMGKFVPVKNEDEVRFITDYILTVLGNEELKSLDIYKDCLHKYNDTNKVTHIGTCRVLSMPCIVYCIDTQDGLTPKPFKTTYGTGYPASFCYVFNTVDPDMCSEFGDCFFEKRADNYYHRVSQEVQL